MAAKKKTRNAEEQGASFMERYKAARWPTLVLLALITLVFYSVFQDIKDERVFLGGDNADYYVLARSIEMGEGFRNVSSLDAPPNNHFPPGYPLIMAGLMKLGITEISTLTFMNGLFLWAGLVLAFLMFTKWTGQRELSALVVLLCTYNAHLLMYSTIMMSEVPYMLTMFAALYLYGGYMGTEQRRARYWYLGGLLAVTILMLYIRTAGVAVVGAIGLHMFLSARRAPAVLYVALALLSQVPWQVRAAQLGGSSYTRQLVSINPYKPELGTVGASDVVRRIGLNARRYFAREVPSAVMPWISQPDKAPLDSGKRWPLALALVGLSVAGLFAVQRKWRLLVLGLLVLNFLLLMLWPEVWFGVRFILPLIPLLLLLMIAGAYHLLGMAAVRLGRKPEWAWAVVLPLAGVYHAPLLDSRLAEGADFTTATMEKLNKEYIMRVDMAGRVIYAMCKKGLEFDRKSPYPDRFTEYIGAAQWLAKNSPRDATTVVCCRKPTLMYLFSGRYVTSFAKDLDPAVVIAGLERNKVSHVVVDQLGFADVSRYLLPAVQRDPLKFPVLQQFPSKVNPQHITYLLGFRPDLGYTGPWVNGRKHGEGRWLANDGSLFAGHWVNDTIRGEGRFTRADGSVLEGEWENGKLNGFGRELRNGTVVQEGQWAHGQFLGAGTKAQRTP